jgi:amino acid transporter
LYRIFTNTSQLEFIVQKPRFFITCVYGIIFLILGNTSGNATAFAIYFLIASGLDLDQVNVRNRRGDIYGIAIGLLTFCSALHIFSRRGGIIISDTLGTIKMVMIFTLSILGFIHAGKKYLQSKGIDELAVPSAVFNITSAMVNNATSSNMDIHTSFLTQRHDLGSYSESFLFALFAFSGFEQPFYVLGEVRRPRKVFPIYVPAGVILAFILYMLINTAYFCVVPKEAYLSTPTNTIGIASTFLHYLFDTTMGPHTATRVMAGLICISIFGNVVVMTFTAARVDQEIAKEGILPFSLLIGTGQTTPWAWFKSRIWDKDESTPTPIDHLEFERHREKSPIAAILFHWMTLVLLIAMTSMLPPVTAFSFLTSLYAYANAIIMGTLISGCLLYLKIDSLLRGTSGRNWKEYANYVPLFSPLHVLIYFCSMSFFMFSKFVRPAADSAYASTVQGYHWWILPTIGLSSLLWGVFWWLGLLGIQWLRRVKLTVRRTPCIEKDEDGNWVQKAELVEHKWLIHVKSDGEYTSEMT